jgi:hypothetical protein
VVRVFLGGAVDRADEFGIFGVVVVVGRVQPLGLSFGGFHGAVVSTCRALFCLVWWVSACAWALASKILFRFSWARSLMTRRQFHHLLLWIRAGSSVCYMPMRCEGFLGV